MEHIDEPVMPSGLHLNVLCKIDGVLKRKGMQSPKSQAELLYSES